MNLLQVLAVFVFVKETVSTDRFELYSDIAYAPLGLIKNRESSKLELAIPKKSKYGNGGYAVYIHKDLEDEKGPVEECFTACPAQSNVYVEGSLERSWKEMNNLTYGTLFIADKWPLKYRTVCSSDATPSIEKAPMKNKNDNEEYCSGDKGDLYDVGFPVSIRDIKGVQFVSVYKVCYSTVENEGTLYTAHRITSPSLLLDDVWEFVKFDPKKFHECILNNSDSNEQKIYEKQYPYQFVGIDDMPTKVWGTTTQFSFNFTPVTENKDAMAGMITVDNFIRLYSKETNKPLTVYSGVHQLTFDKKIFPFAPEKLSMSKLVKSFWRIIKDDKDHAIIIVTQHTKVKCVNESFLCHENRTMIKEYKKGGCTYTCSVTGNVEEQVGIPRYDVRERLQLPRLRVIEDLDLTFPRNISTETSSEEDKIKHGAPVETPSEKISIHDFFKEGATFESVLEKADPVLAKWVRFYAPSTEKSYNYSKPSGGSGGSSGGILSLITMAGLSDMGGGGDYGGGGGGGGGDAF